MPSLHSVIEKLSEKPGYSRFPYFCNKCAILVSSPDPTYEGGSGDIRLIPQASLDVNYFLERNFSLPSTLQKTQSVLQHQKFWDGHSRMVSRLGLCFLIDHTNVEQVQVTRRTQGVYRILCSQKSMATPTHETQVCLRFPRRSKSHRIKMYSLAENFTNFKVLWLFAEVFSRKLWNVALIVPKSFLCESFLYCRQSCHSSS